MTLILAKLNIVTLDPVLQCWSGLIFQLSWWQLGDGVTISFPCSSLMINWCYPPRQKMALEGVWWGPCPLRLAPCASSSCFPALPQRSVTCEVSQMGEFQERVTLAGWSQSLQELWPHPLYSRMKLRSGGQLSIKERILTWNLEGIGCNGGKSPTLLEL